MKINYEFATETVEIEVTEDWGNILIDLNRQGYNNAHTHRRHNYSLDACVYEGADFATEDTGLANLFKDESLVDRLPTAIAQLRPQQQELIQRAYCRKEKLGDIARSEGVSNAAITNRLKKIYAALKKSLSEGV